MPIVGTSPAIHVPAPSGAVYHGATCYLNSAQAVPSGVSVVPFAAAWDDTDGFFSAADFGFLIPTGMGGRYQLSYTLAGAQGSTSTTYEMASGLLVNTADPNNATYAYMTKVAFIDNYGFGVSGLVIATLAVGDVVTTLGGQSIAPSRNYRTNAPGDSVHTMPLGGTFMQIMKVG